MKEKHPIDSFFKDKLANRQYPMKEEYWASASALIEANAARKRRKFLWFFLFLGLLSGFSLIGYFTYQNTSGTSSELVQDLPASSSESKLPIVEQVPQSTPSEAASPELLASSNSTPAHAEASTKKSKNINSITPTKSSEYSNNKNLQSDNHQQRADLQVKKLEGTVLNETSPAKKEELTDLSANPTFIDNELREEKRIHDEGQLAAQGNKRVLGIAGQELREELSTQDPGVLEQIERKDTKDTKGHRVAAQFLEEKSLYLSDISLSKDQAFVPPFLAMNRRHSLGLNFGFAIHDAMGTKLEQQQSIGMAPLVGLAYRFQLNRNLSLLSGVRYTQTPSLAGDSTYLSTSFSFGEIIQGTKIRPLALHQLEVPLSLRWQAGTRSSIALGGYIRYLINVQSEVSRFESNPFETAPGPVNKAWGYKQGFEKMDLGLQLGYYYQLSEGLHLGVEAQYGLRDLRDNEFYRENNFDRNLNARLVLRYDFWRF